MSRAFLIVTLVFAGEMVFGLPFHTARFFRPTLLDVFGFTNTELGDLFAVYGVMAMLSYFPGGVLADRFPARNLITASLAMTAAGGLYMASIPGELPMALLYGYWGVTTIFLFWGALIRATREWGGASSQGIAFGVLDAGRGLVAAAAAGLAVAVFAAQMPEAAATAGDDVRRAGFRSVILIYTAMTAAAAVLAWMLIPVADATTSRRSGPLDDMALVLQRPLVWAQAGVIVCAYCGFKGLDNYSLYAVQVLGMDEIDAAWFATLGAYLRPVGAIAAGLCADRFGAARSIAVLFAALVVTYSLLASITVGVSGMTWINVNIFASFLAVFALRGVYFALLEENRTPAAVTGTAVGLVSLVGFTPDVFFAPIAGRILDANPGVGGHQDYFALLAAIAAAGVGIVAWMMWLRRRGNNLPA